MLLYKKLLLMTFGTTLVAYVLKLLNRLIWFHISVYYLLQNSRQRSLNGSYNWLVWSKEKRTTETETLNLHVDTEMTWAQPEPNTSKIILHDLYKINYTWPVNDTVAGHWYFEGGLHYNLTQYKYSRRHDMRGIVLKAGLAVRFYIAHMHF